MKQLSIGETTPSTRRKLVVATGYTAWPLAAVATTVVSPDVLLTVLLLALCITSVVIWVVARIVLAPTDNPTRRLCRLLRAARGR